MILCCGEALIDFLPRSAPGGATVYEPFCGGSVFNTAIALGRLGVSTGIFNGLSTDFFGDWRKTSGTISMDGPDDRVPATATAAAISSCGPRCSFVRSR